ncbi:hypothetical protein BDR04DRAFT_1111692 [Suillus decipiens]|nr:hypothetical protein BDR04DRAFT_1111692 [Suillus decipiens]
MNRAPSNLRFTDESQARPRIHGSRGLSEIVPTVGGRNARPPDSGVNQCQIQQTQADDQ